METLGLSSYAYYWATRPDGPDPMTPWDLLKRVAELDLGVVQICENVPLIDWSVDELARFGQKARQMGIVLELGTRGLDVAAIGRVIEVADRVGARLLRLVAWAGGAERRNAAMRELGPAIDRLLPIARSRGIVLALENYFDLGDDDLASLVAKYADEHLGVCLDTANSVGLLRPPIETVRLLAPYAVSVHLKDFIVRKPPIGYRITWVPLGQGMLDVPTAFAELRRSARRPNVLLELWVDRDRGIATTVRKEANWVRESVAYAKEQWSELIATTPSQDR